MSATVTTPPDLDSQAFRAWLAAADYRFRPAAKRYEDHVYLIALDFSIAATGETPEAADATLRRMVLEYLYVFYEQGRPFNDAYRRAPLRMRAVNTVATYLFRRFGTPVHQIPDYRDEELSNAVPGHAA
jgi:hypothetical protein